MKTLKIALPLLILLATPFPAISVEVAPRISDREIIEKLSLLEEGQKSTNKRIDDLRADTNKRFDDLRTDMNSRFDDLRAEMNKRFDMLTWIMGLFVTVSMAVLGVVLRMQWQMNRRQAQMETALETQKDEILFFKELVGKLLPSR